MKTTTTWLLAGAALTLIAGTSVAIAANSKDQAKDAPKTERREVHIYRQNGEERIVIDKDGEHHEFIPSRGETRRYELRRGDGDGAIMIHRGGAGRAEHMKALLQLRPNQEPALKAFLDATQVDRGDRMVRFERGGVDDDARTTTDRLAEMERKLADQQAAMKKRIDATRAFYAQLDEKQRKAFDAMPMLMMVGPGLGPMLMPGPIPIVHRMPPVPPIPPAPPERFQDPTPPVPPTPPRPPRS